MDMFWYLTSEEVMQKDIPTKEDHVMNLLRFEKDFLRRFETRAMVLLLVMLVKKLFPQGHSRALAQMLVCIADLMVLANTEHNNREQALHFLGVQHFAFSKDIEHLKLARNALVVQCVLLPHLRRTGRFEEERFRELERCFYAYCQEDTMFPGLFCIMQQPIQESALHDRAA